MTSESDGSPGSVTEMSGLCFSRLRIRFREINMRIQSNTDKIGKIKVQSLTESDQLFIPFQAYN